MSPNLDLKEIIENWLRSISVDDLKQNDELRAEVGRWIELRGKQNLLKDPDLRGISERYEKSS